MGVNMVYPSPNISRVHWRKFSYPILVGLVLAALPFLPVFWGKIPVNGDDLEFGLALTTEFHRAFVGEWLGPTGFPWVAEGQMAFFHPLRWLVLFLPPWSPADNALGMVSEYLLTLYLVQSFALWGMFRLSRQLGASGWSAWMPALLYGNFGFHLSQATNLNLLLASAALPWAAFAWLSYSREYEGKKGRGSLLFLALVVASIGLAGQPQALVISLVVLAFFVLAFPLPKRGRGIPQAFGAVFLGVGIALPALYATANLAAYSRRSATTFGSQGGLGLTDFFKGWIPLVEGGGAADIAAFDPVASATLSFLWPLALILLFLQGVKGRSERFFLWGGGLSLVLATGPGYGLLVSLLPFLAVFRDVHRFLLGTLFFLAVWWAKRLSRDERIAPKDALWSGLVVVVLLGFLFRESLLAPWVIGSLALVGMGIVAIVRGGRWKRVLWVLLIVEVGAGLPHRWHSRFFHYNPQGEVDSLSGEECPRGVWFVDIYRESLKQEAMDTGIPYGAYLGSPNGPLWDDPLFDCPRRVLRYQLNSPLQTRWAKDIQDLFIPANGLGHPTLSDYLMIDEVWSPAPLEGWQGGEQRRVGQRVYWRYKRDAPFEFHGELLHFGGTVDVREGVWVDEQGREPATLAHLFVGNLDRYPVLGEGWFEEGWHGGMPKQEWFMGNWWVPGWEENGSPPIRVFYAFVSEEGVIAFKNSSPTEGEWVFNASKGKLIYRLPGFSVLAPLSLFLLLGGVWWWRPWGFKAR